MTKLKDLKEIITRNRNLLKQNYNVKVLGIFGSFSRGDTGRKSDIDILVDFSETPDFFEFIRLEEFLRKLLGRKVDLVTRNALKPSIKNAILKEMVYV